MTTSESDDVPDDVTQLLHRAETGDGAALNEAYSLLRDRIHGVARALIARRHPGDPLQATDLLHEAFLRSAKAAADGASESGEPRWKDREHFVMSQVQTMKNLLIDAARRKRNDPSQRALEQLLEHGSILDPRSHGHDTLFVDDACRALAEKEPVAAQLVELHYFGGLTWEEAGDLLDLPIRKRKALVAFAKTWLLKELEDGGR